MVKIQKINDKWVVNINGQQTEFRFFTQATLYVMNIYGAAKIGEMASQGNYKIVK